MNTSSLLLAAVLFLKVFLQGFQTKNVSGNHYVPAFVTSVLMGIMEVAVITGIAAKGWSAVCPVAIGGSLGVITSMHTHNALFRKTKHVNAEVKSGDDTGRS